MPNKKPFPYVPIGPRVIVLRDKSEEKSEGGVILVKETQEREKPNQGVVVALGDVQKLKLGDRVLFAVYSGIVIPAELDGEHLSLLEEEVLCYEQRAS